MFRSFAGSIPMSHTFFHIALSTFVHMKWFGLSQHRKSVVILTGPLLFSMDVKQKQNWKHLYLPYLTFFLLLLYLKIKKTDHQTTIESPWCKSLVDTMVWGWIQLSEKLKLSQTFLVNILMVYFLCSNWSCKSKGLLIKIKVIKGFSAK